MTELVLNKIFIVIVILLGHNYLQICDNLFNGSFTDEQAAVQKVVADVEMYSNLIKQVPP